MGPIMTTTERALLSEIASLRATMQPFLERRDSLDKIIYSIKREIDRKAEALLALYGLGGDL